MSELVDTRAIDYLGKRDNNRINNNNNYYYYYYYYK